MTEPVTSELPESTLAVLLRQFAHDLKGHLGTTGLWFYLLETASSDEDRARGVQGLRDTFATLDRAATDLADAGRSLSGPEVPAFDAVDLEAMVSTVAMAAGSTARGRGISLDIDLPPRPWPGVHGHHEGLARALERLFFGAVAHAPNGAQLGIQVVVDREFIRVRVPIASDMPGPIPSLRERLALIVNGARESGLALPLARETFQQHGGELVPLSETMLEARIPVRATPPVFEMGS
jgi:K+-sensing histidine kinase KdpD